MCLCVWVLSGVDGNAETPITVGIFLSLEYQQQKLNSQNQVFFPPKWITEKNIFNKAILQIIYFQANPVSVVNRWDPHHKMFPATQKIK